MKYIRTKDDFIYKITTRDFGIFVIDEKGNLIGRIDVDEIVNQADTIEELCDGFIEVGAGRFAHIITDNFNQISIGHKRLMQSDYSKRYLVQTIYGYIETDKGLIYVAKMNDKGELELL